jgi:CheY-like chemotaxis protein/tetratricopeptide (TPR) repeat protein
MRLELKPLAISSPPVPSSPKTNDATVEAKESLNEGVKAAQYGDRSRARAALLRAVELDPKCENGWMWLASISEFPEELLVFLTKALEINPENAKAQEWLTATHSLMARTFVQRGTDALEDGNREFAAECFANALEHDKRNVMAWMWTASLAETEEEKIEFLENVLKIEPNNQEASVELEATRNGMIERMLGEAKAAALNGHRDAVLRLLDVVTAETPRCTEAWLLKSQVVDGFEHKLQCFDIVLAYDPENSAAATGREMLLSIVNFKPTEPEPEPIPEPESEFEPEPVETVQTSPFDGYAQEEEADTEVVFELPENATQLPVFTEPAFPMVAPESDPQTLDLRVEEMETAESWSGAPDVSVPHFTVEEINDVDADPIQLTGAEIFVEHHETDAVSLSFEEDESCDEPVPFPTGRDEVVNEVVATAACPYCDSANSAQAISCDHCYAVLTLSDLEMILSNQKANRMIIANAVARMENARTERDFNAADLTVLGIGHLNLRNFDSGYACLFDASQLSPGNVVLERQVNSLLIRLEEIRQQEESHVPMTAGKTILVVDDSPTVRKLIAGKLEKCGHEVYCSNDGVEAMEYLQSLTPDLILLDIAMPRMDGYQVCKLIRSNPVTKDVPIVMISGKDGFFDKVRGRMAGTTGYITKPFGPEALMKAVEHYLSGQPGEFEQ